MRLATKCLPQGGSAKRVSNCPAEMATKISFFSHGFPANWHPALRNLIHASFLVLCLPFIGCGMAKAKQDCEKLIRHHFLALSTNNFDEVFLDYGSQFFLTTAKSEWSNALARANERLGPYQRHTIASWQISSGAGSFGSGTKVVIKCHVIYSSNATQETFTLLKGSTDPGFKIVGHQITSATPLAQ